MKDIRWSPAARRDLDEAATWFAQQGGLAVEDRFIDAVEATTMLIRRHPAVGSSRHAEQMQELPVPLRFFPVRDFDRHLVYYLDLPDHVDVIRVWNSARGLEALLEDGEATSP